MMSRPVIADVRVALLGDSARVEAAFPGALPEESEHLGYSFRTVTRDASAYRFHFFAAATDKPVSEYMRQKLSSAQMLVFLVDDRTGDALADLLDRALLARPVILVASPQEEAMVRATDGYTRCCDRGLPVSVVSRGLFDESPLDLILNFALEHVKDIAYREIR
ncbi:hypothetical protein QR46_1262 [Giardia duodenalis assemblage B]|uniref:Uncharacterized protein n=1 Tax=Giardia duodenalis assemblage B TaxID=1394984 RepID=A0A132NXH3_GIAIN|nr:hypothetical protein QR46_1262 [Giardia intestinalis assemblage B]